MAFLAAIASKVLIGLLSALGGWLLKHFQVWQKDQKEEKEANDKTTKAVDDLKKSVTKEERDNAAKGIADDV